MEIVVDCALSLQYFARFVTERFVSCSCADRTAIDEFEAAVTIVEANAVVCGAAEREACRA